MNIDETYLITKVIAGEERHLESGDNPDEREKRKEKLPEEEVSEDEDLESGDNPDERRKGI